jgi:hypothetical protein
LPNRIRTIGPLLAAVLVVAACGQPALSTQTRDSGGSPVPAPGSSSGSGGPSEVTTETVDGPVARLEIASDSGSISVTGVDGDAVTVTRSIYRDPVAPTETVRHDGDLLHIESECPDPAPNQPCRIDYDVQAPRGTVVTLAGASGDLDTSGLTAEQSARSVSGDVELVGIGADTVAARSTSGDVRLGLDVVPRRVEAESVSGGVTVTVPDGTYRVDADTVSGDVDVDVPTDPSAGADLRLQSTSGDIEVRRG